MLRVPFIVANWKMHKSLKEGIILVNRLMQALEKQPKKVDIILCPPFIHLVAIGKLFKRPIPTQLYLGAQNCHHEGYGAFTGEVSAAMLSSIGTRYVIIGHSERRKYFNEDHQLLIAKMTSVLRHKMRPIFCCGEDGDIREQGNQIEWVIKQIELGLGTLTAEQVSQVIIAYEPIWAIGSGHTPSLLEIEMMYQAIKKNLADRYSTAIADNIPILYGGSCKEQYAHMLLSNHTVDGLLVGSASLDFKNFWPIIQVTDH